MANQVADLSNRRRACGVSRGLTLAVLAILVACSDVRRTGTGEQSGSRTATRGVEIQPPELEKTPPSGDPPPGSCPGAVTALAAAPGGPLDPDGGDPLDPPPPPSTAFQFAVLLEEGDPGPFRLARRLTREGFEKRHAELAAQGFYLHDLEIVSEIPVPCFSGLWYYGPGEQHLDLGSPASLFVAAHLGAELDSKEVVDVETYIGGGERLFAGVWREGARDLDLEIDVGAETVRRLVASGSRPQDIESWEAASGRRYMVLHGPAASPVVLRLDRTSDGFDADVVAMIRAGLRPVELEIDAAGTEPRYTSVWQRSSRAFWIFAGFHEGLQDCRIVSLGLEAPELLPTDLAKCRELGDMESDLSSLTVFDRDVITAIESADQPGSGGAAPVHGDLPHHDPDLPLDVVTLPSEPLRLLDFASSRTALKNPLAIECVVGDCVLRHQGVLHDAGPSGPG